jgi:hypothetical protein
MTSDRIIARMTLDTFVAFDTICYSVGCPAEVIPRGVA